MDKQRKKISYEDEMWLWKQEKPEKPEYDRTNSLYAHTEYGEWLTQRPLNPNKKKKRA